jgi:hypothetical protein
MHSRNAPFASEIFLRPLASRQRGSALLRLKKLFGATGY